MKKYQLNSYLLSFATTILLTTGTAWSANYEYEYGHCAFSTKQPVEHVGDTARMLQYKLPNNCDFKKGICTITWTKKIHAETRGRISQRKKFGSDLDPDFDFDRTIRLTTNIAGVREAYYRSKPTIYKPERYDDNDTEYHKDQYDLDDNRRNYYVERNKYLKKSEEPKRFSRIYEFYGTYTLPRPEFDAFLRPTLSSTEKITHSFLITRESALYYEFSPKMYKQISSTTDWEDYKYHVFQFVDFPQDMRDPILHFYTDSEEVWVLKLFGMNQLHLYIKMNCLVKSTPIPQEDISTLERRVLSLGYRQDILSRARPEEDSAE